MPERVRFSQKAVRRHLTRHHPGCPPLIVGKIVERVTACDWDCSIGAAIGISMQSFVRHEITDYELLYKIPGLEKEEARIIVKDEVNDVIQRWAHPLPQPEPSDSGDTPVDGQP